jgi:hypothetical protein
MLFIVTGIMPLVARFAEVEMPPETISILMGETYQDLFTYWKGWLLMIPVAAIIFYFVSDILTNGKSIDIKAFFKNPPVIFMLVYLLFVILSGIFSVYPHTVLNGTYERGESVFIQISYVAVFIIAMYYVREGKHVKAVISGFAFSGVLMGLVCLGQLFGFDIFTTEFFSWLTFAGTKAGNDLAAAGRSFKGIMTPRFTMAYGTLFNPNTLGLFTSMLAPVLLFFGFAYKGKKVFNIALLSGGALMLTGLAASRSLGGLVGFMAEVTVIAVTYVCHIVIQRKKLPLPVWAGALGIIVIAVLSIAFIPPVRTNATYFYDKFIASLESGNADAPPDDYVFDGGTLRITNGDATLATLEANPADGWLTVRDGTGAEVPVSNADTATVPASSSETSVWVYDVPGYKKISINRYYEFFVLSGLTLGTPEGRFMALMPGMVPAEQSETPTGTMLTPPTEQPRYQQVLVPVDVSQPVETFGFKGWENFATDRGYIWSRALPVMFRHPILGSGSDTFINEFPQDDIIGKLRFMPEPYIVVDKAHNLFIQTGIVTGCVSLLALIALFGHYLFTTFLSIIKSKDESGASFCLRLGVLAAVSAFVVSSMSTDSTVASTGVFYVILGLGYALNKMAREKKL